MAGPPATSARPHGSASLPARRAGRRLSGTTMEEGARLSGTTRGGADQRGSLRPERRARALSRAGRHDAAIADYSKVIELDPERVGAYFGRGIAHRMNGDLDATIADYGEAIARSPDYADFYYFRGLALEEKQEPDAAIADFRKAVAVDPGHSRAAEALERLGAAP